jgi:TPR repeat protein
MGFSHRPSFVLAARWREGSPPVSSKQPNPKASAASTPSRVPAQAQNRALKQPKSASGEAGANAPAFIDPKDKDFYRKAQAGDSGAMENLAYSYYQGRLEKKDYQQAVDWFRKAADAGNADAMYRLGFMYEHGRGVTQDYQQAVSWYSKAADGDSAIGMNAVGEMYEKGHGVGKDLPQALAWYRKAAQLGYYEAQDNLKRLGENP